MKVNIYHSLYIFDNFHLVKIVSIIFTIIGNQIIKFVIPKNILVILAEKLRKASNINERLCVLNYVMRGPWYERDSMWQVLKMNDIKPVLKMNDIKPVLKTLMALN